MGWKHLDVTFIQLVGHVEREPMWDGNTRSLVSVEPSGFTLSENQCGMETRDPRSRVSRWPVVEREPMWDGNIASPKSWAARRGVEREPMWDGNGISSLRRCARSRVEREPMWDGN